VATTRIRRGAIIRCVKRRKKGRKPKRPTPSRAGTRQPRGAEAPVKPIDKAAIPAWKSPRSFVIVFLLIAVAGVIVLTVHKHQGRSVHRDQNLNVLLITLDTTRADRLGCYGDAGARTPNLDRLAAEGIRFANAYCQVPLTLPSHASIMTGRNPYHHGVHNNGTYVLPAAEVTLAERLKNRGYETAAITASFSVNSRFGLGQGFDVYDDNFLPSPGSQSVSALERRAPEVSAVFSSWMARRPAGKFFAWVHFYDPHMPYDPPGTYLTDFPGRPYDGEIAFMDTYVGEVVRLLRDKGLLENTLVVIAGDHGEAFGEKGERGHGVFLYEMAMRVPLIFSSKTLPRGVTVNSRARLIDIVPTILDILNIGSAAGVDGLSLVPVIEGKKERERDVYLESFYPRENWGWSELVGLISEKWKYIQAPRPELYDLSGDPMEKDNVFARYPERTSELKSRLQGMLAASAPGAPSAQKELSRLEQEKLRSLGYVQFAGSGAGGDRPDPKDRLQDLELYQKARDDQSSGKLGEAEQAYRELLLRFPRIPESYANLAEVQVKRRDVAGAIETMKKGVEAVPGSETLWVRLGQIYLITEKFPEASEAMRRALDVNPESLDALTVSVIVYERSNRLPEAMDYLERALKLDPGNEFFRMTYATNLSRVGRLDEAIRFFSALTRDFPDRAVYFQNLGIVYGMSKDTDKAIENLEKAVALEPSPKAFYSLATAYANKGRLADAVRALESYLADPAGESEATVRRVRAQLEILKSRLR
jgi:arylsulfatase A-like enzyme/cytochrome c-type biogenesis protein CcmH/NrfG